MIIQNSLLFALIMTISLWLNAQTENANQYKYDKRLADKYGLTIPDNTQKPDAAPDWLRNTDMIGWSFDLQNVWKGFKNELKDTLIWKHYPYKANISEQKTVVVAGNFDGTTIKGVPLISHVPVSKMGFKQAHDQGFKVIPYVHFRDIRTYGMDQDLFVYNHPEILQVDEQGRWMHIKMDGTYRLFRYQVCNNSPSYWKLSLDYIRKLMEMGADGVFIDNIKERDECYGVKYNIQDTVMANPEFPPYKHEHLFSDVPHNYACGMFLQAVRELVKSYGEDKIVILNTGDPYLPSLQNNSDGVMWESFIYSWAWKGRYEKHTWQDIKDKAKKLEWYTNSGKIVTVLPYFDPKRNEVKEDVFWAFSAARLMNFIFWSDLTGTNAEIIYKTHTGKALEPLLEEGEIAHRTFENGVIVLNNTDKEQSIEIALPKGYTFKNLTDIFNNIPVSIKGGKIRVKVPAKMARIYINPRIFNINQKE